MLAYLLKRLLLIFPTLLGIMLVNFLVIQLVPGGPLETMMAKIKAQSPTDNALQGGGAEGRLSGESLGENQTASPTPQSAYRGNRGLNEELLQELRVQYGLDKPAYQRFWKMLTSYAVFDLGESFYQDRSVVSLVLDKLPVSISLGLWSTLLIYLLSIPLGIAKALRDGGGFDIFTSTLITIGYAVPNFLLAAFLIILFAGGQYFDWFPLRGLVSEHFDTLNPLQKILDYFHHLALPLFSLVISGFASLTMLTKNSFIDQIHLQYVTTARAKGLSERGILYGHVFRNAMLIVIAGFPSAFLSIFFTSSLIIEVLFSLDGLGLLGFEAALRYDYPIIFGTLFVFSLLGLSLKLVSDLLYVAIDPRINFEKL